MRRIAALTALAVVLAGCASAPEPQKTIQAGPDESIIVVRRGNSLFGSVVNADIFVDGKPVVKIGNGSIVRFTVSNGTHTISTAFHAGTASEQRSEAIRFTARSEETLFVMTLSSFKVMLKLDSTRPLEALDTVASGETVTDGIEAVTAAEEESTATPGASREQRGQEEQAPPPRFFFSVGLQPKVNWGLGLGGPEFESDATGFTTYETSLRFRWGLNLLLSANLEDTIIGKASAFAGFLGYNKFALRVSTSRITGVTRWHHPADLILNVDTTYFSADLLYQIIPRVGLYAGLSYIDFTIPVDLPAFGASFDKDNEYFASEDFYDKNFNAKIYGLSMVADGFNSRMFLSKQEEKDAGITSYPYFRLWGAMVTTFGLAQLTVSPEAMEGLKDINPGFTVKDDRTSVVFGFYAEYSGGVMGVLQLPGKARLGLGIGYTLATLMATSFDTPNPRKGELEIQPSAHLFRHGFVIKGAVAW